MNRIILIGNGFDLAHGLKTSYNDFIKGYWEKVKRRLIKKSYSSVCQYRYSSDNFDVFFFENDDIKLILPLDFKDIPSDKPEFKNNFLKIITTKSTLKNWVDIEEEYYKLLQEIINKKIPDNKKNYINIKRLNIDFSHVKEELAHYLIKETTKGIGGKAIEFVNNTINKNINSTFEYSDFTQKWGDSHFGFERPNYILFLNFNYSNTEDLYFKQSNVSSGKVETIHIHGELKDIKNPIIFGYGDEIGKEYEEIENLNDNDFLENIKSIRYSNTCNYKRLLDFINSDEYQIFLFGHSCGLSDRTLLNTLFEHKNCVSIKPFYHKKEDGTDNYSNIVRNISRHFRDKAMMREKVVNKEYCKPLS